MSTWMILRRRSGAGSFKRALIDSTLTARSIIAHGHMLRILAPTSSRTLRSPVGASSASGAIVGQALLVNSESFESGMNRMRDAYTWRTPSALLPDPAPAMRRRARQGGADFPSTPCSADLRCCQLSVSRWAASTSNHPPFVERIFYCFSFCSQPRRWAAEKRLFLTLIVLGLARPRGLCVARRIPPAARGELG